MKLLRIEGPHRAKPKRDWEKIALIVALALVFGMFLLVSYKAKLAMENAEYWRTIVYENKLLL